MKIIWTDGAIEDFRTIVDRIALGSKDAAHRVATTIYDRIATLQSFPSIGTKRQSDDERELLIKPWPYVAIYEIAEDGIFIHGIMHTSRDRPE